MRTEPIAREADVDPEALLDLVRMVDLTRINGIGPTFARILLNMGITGLARLSREDPHEHAAVLAEHLQQSGYTGPAVTDWDVAA